MRSPGTYNAISSAIAAGKNQNNDIAQAVDLLASSLTSCLSNLAMSLTSKFEEYFVKKGGIILPEVEFPEVAELKKLLPADQVQTFIDTALKLAKMDFSQKNKAISLS
ncbi:hypothetical protein [Lactobacillus delbrueckii]|nr:hypothetical protein [Lactobacillus delbrueckii]